MFTQPCFIRKNTPDLMQALIEIGYEYTPIRVFSREKLLVASNGFYLFDFPRSCENNDIFIDCGNNEKLFFAIAALKNDSDRNQWFIIDDYIGQESLPNYFIGSMHYCPVDKHESYFPHYFRYHKATVNELIEHFKDK